MVIKSDSGLSSGAKAGVGVGVAMGAIAIIALLAWLFMSRRKKQQQLRQQQQPQEPVHGSVSQIGSVYGPPPAWSPGTPKQQADSPMVHEKSYSSDGARAELDTAEPTLNHRVHEMG